MKIINCDTIGLSHFTGDFIGAAVQEGQLYLATAASLLECGEENPGVSCGVTTGWLDFKSSKVKNLIFLILQGKFPAGVEVTVLREHLGKTATSYYTRGVRPDVGTERTTQIPLGHTKRGTYWKVKIMNKDGGFFRLRTASVLLNLTWREK